jgi:prepilin-type N-terminal cleavage/methylation domain-containing protein
MKKALESSAGFTLIEVMAASAVVAVSMMSVMGLTAWLMRSSAWSTHMLQAAAAGQSLFEDLSSADYDTVGTGTDAVGGFTREWTATVTNRVKVVNVTVSWDGLEGGAKAMTFRTILSDPTVSKLHLSGFGDILPFPTGGPMEEVVEDVTEGVGEILSP